MYKRDLFPSIFLFLSQYEITRILIWAFKKIKPILEITIRPTYICWKFFPSLPIGLQRKPISEVKGIVMGDHLVRAEEFEKKAEKKLNRWGIFGSKYEDAADLLEKAANSYKLAKSCKVFVFRSGFLRIRYDLIFKRLLRSVWLGFMFNSPAVYTVNVFNVWIVSGNQAGKAYLKLADCHLKVSSFCLQSWFWMQCIELL